MTPNARRNQPPELRDRAEESLRAAAAGLVGGITGLAVIKVITPVVAWVLVPGAIGTLRTVRGDLS